MSLLVTIKTRVTDPKAVEVARHRLEFPAPVTGTAQLYGGEATGLLVQLPGWRYPVVIDIASGTLSGCPRAAAQAPLLW